MTNKEELIKWMKEQRVELPFESKVALIWEYWTNRDTIPNLEKELTIKKSECEFRERQNEELNIYLTQKENKVAQLEEVLRGSAIIFEKQQQIIDEKTETLRKEEEKNTDNQEYQKHLRSDVLRLAEERKELTNRLKELSEIIAKSSKIREKELNEKQEKIKELQKQILDERQSHEKELTESIAELTEEKNQVTKELNTWKDAFPRGENATNVKWSLNYYREQLEAERGWWDKWIADERLSHSYGFPRFVHQKTGKEFTLRISSSDSILDYGMTNNVSLADAKKMVKAIAEWYITNKT